MSSATSGTTGLAIVDAILAGERDPVTLATHRDARVKASTETIQKSLVGWGTGKSALIRQILRQLEARGETATVYDPALEYTTQFYTPARGDLILNPLDARSPRRPTDRP